MARYELILRLDGALWLRIILKPLVTPKGAMDSGISIFHMGRYELILRLDGALWLTIIFKPLLTKKNKN